MAYGSKRVGSFNSRFKLAATRHRPRQTSALLVFCCRILSRGSFLLCFSEFPDTFSHPKIRLSQAVVTGLITISCRHFNDLTSNNSGGRAPCALIHSTGLCRNQCELIVPGPSPATFWGAKRPRSNRRLRRQLQPAHAPAIRSAPRRVTAARLASHSRSDCSPFALRVATVVALERFDPSTRLQPRVH